MSKVFYRNSARDLLKQRELEQEVSPEILRARTDFDYFYWYMTQDKRDPFYVLPHQELWRDELITGQSNDVLIQIAGPHTDILGPRGSGKSTFLGLWDAWVIGIHTLAGRFLPQLLISYVIDVARVKSAVIKQTIESSRYQEVFPMVRPGKKWGDEQWAIDYAFAQINVIGQDATTMKCAGLKGAIVSARAALIILDDIIKSADDIANSEVREKMVNNWESCAEFTLWEGGRAVCLGTQFRPDDIHITTFIAPKWRQIRQSALLTNPETGEEYSYCESMHSLALLQEEREKKPTAFYFQRQNQVVRVSSMSLDPEWILVGDPLPIDQYEMLVVGVDLSSKLKEKNDYTCFCLGGRTRDQKFHILDMRHGRWAGNIEKLDILIELLLDWGILDWQPHPDAILDKYAQANVSTAGGQYNQRLGRIVPMGITTYFYVEDVQYQGSLAGDFNTYIINELRLYDLIYRPSPAHQDKLMRLRSVSGLYENRLVTFNRWRNLGRMKEELTMFGGVSHDDAMDANVHCLLGLRGLPALETA